MIHYYLSVFPVEAFIASELDPENFGTYMATGSKIGSLERIIFIETEGGFGDHFDWRYAEKRCVSHPDGKPKHSVYLSVYRALEHIPLKAMKNIYLTTKDGRTLELESVKEASAPNHNEYYIYQELSPMNPLVVSTLKPEDFGNFVTSGKSKIFAPKLIFTDLKIIDFDNMEASGNIGHTYDKNLEHLKSCINAVVNKEKQTKTIERSHIESFSYQSIARGIYVCDDESMLTYPMKSKEELNTRHFEWAKSALIV
ncbi:MAG: hypothetical protein ACLFST_09455 [Spirochaetia bacterium]